MKANLTYFKRLIDSEDSASVKRFLGLIWTLFLMVAATVILFVKVPLANQSLMHDILLYGFAIVFISLLGISIQDFASLGVKKAEMLASAAPDVTIQNAQNVTGATKVDTVNAEKVETVNSQTTNINNEPTDAK